MKFRSFLVPIGCVAGTALGIYLGRGPLAPDNAGPSDDAFRSVFPGKNSPTILSNPGSAADGNPGMGGKVPVESGAVGVKGASPMADALLGVINNPDGKMAASRFYQMLGNMPSSTLADMIANIDSYPNHSRRRETREMIIDYLTMSDPKKALEVREQLPNKGLFEKSFRQLGRMDPAEALRMRDSYEKAGDRTDALKAIFVGASEVDPAAAFDLLKSLDEAGPQHYHEVFDNWAEMDPVTAAKMALTVEKPAERREALKIVGQEWAERDPQAVLSWIEATDLTSSERESIRKSALTAYAKRDAPAAMELIAEMPPTVQSRVLPEAFRRLAEQDSEAAFAWIKEQPDGFAKSRAINESIWSLAREAPEATIDLAREMPQIKDNALGSAFGRLAETDLEQAMTKAEEWKDDPQYNNIMSNIASNYSQKNPEEALEWAMGLDEKIRSNAASNVISRLANEDPSLAVKQLDELSLPSDDPIYSNAIRNIAGNWARQDPVTAAEWINELPESSTRDQAIGQVADRWTRIDPVSASEWIGSLPEGNGRDQAANRLVNRISNEDPEMATAWAGSIGDENMRNGALMNAYGQWMAIDPDGARAALEQDGNLPDQMKQNFLQRGNPRDPGIRAEAFQQFGGGPFIESAFDN